MDRFIHYPPVLQSQSILVGLGNSYHMLLQNVLLPSSTNILVIDGVQRETSLLDFIMTSPSIFMENATYLVEIIRRALFE
jgi:hypothetical protein